MALLTLHRACAYADIASAMARVIAIVMAIVMARVIARAIAIIIARADGAMTLVPLVLLVSLVLLVPLMLLVLSKNRFSKIEACGDIRYNSAPLFTEK